MSCHWHLIRIYLHKERVPELPRFLWLHPDTPAGIRGELQWDVRKQGLTLTLLQLDATRTHWIIDLFFFKASLFCLFNKDSRKLLKKILHFYFPSLYYLRSRVGRWGVEGGRDHRHKVVLVGGSWTAVCATMCVRVTGASDDKRWQIGVKASRCLLTMPTTENHKHGAAEKMAVKNTYIDTQTGRRRVQDWTKASEFHTEVGGARRSGAVQMGHKEHSLTRSDRLNFYVFIYSFCTLKNPLKKTQTSSLFYIVEISKTPIFKSSKSRNGRADIFSNGLNHSVWPISIFVCILKDGNIKDKTLRISVKFQSTMRWLLFLLLSPAFFLTGLVSDGPPPPQRNTCHVGGLAVSPWNPKIRTLIANKDMRVSDSLLSAMNPQFHYCFQNDGPTCIRMGCQFHSQLQWWMQWLPDVL